MKSIGPLHTLHFRIWRHLRVCSLHKDVVVRPADVAHKSSVQLSTWFFAVFYRPFAFGAMTFLADIHTPKTAIIKIKNGAYPRFFKSNHPPTAKFQTPVYGIHPVSVPIRR